MMGIDALRFADFASQKRESIPPCKSEDGPCPLARLFFDPRVHEVAASDVVQVAAEPYGLLGEADAREVQDVVKATFRNISIHVAKYAPAVGNELDEAFFDQDEKAHFVLAMQLASNTRVQAFGRQVAYAIWASKNFSSPRQLRLDIAQHLRGHLEVMRNFSAEVVTDPLRKIWQWGAGYQFEMAADAETINSIKTMGMRGVVTGPRSAAVLAAEKDAALSGAALVEGRVLLDLVLLHIRSLGQPAHTSLFGAMDVFAAPLATPCPLAEPSAAPGDQVGFREGLLCPLRFGALGLDALRYATTSAGSGPQPVRQ